MAVGVTVMDWDILRMKFKLFSVYTLMLCASVASNAATIGDLSTTAVANKFVDALQHQRYRDAAAMFAPGEVAGDITTTEYTLRRVDDSLSGFSSMHPIVALPDGKSIKLEVAARQNRTMKVPKFVQLRYVSTAGDGEPVFYELNLTADGTPAKILSFWLHFPATDTQSLKRAKQLATTINR